MKRFAQLFQQLDSTTKTSLRLEALVSYLREVPDEDKLWCIALLCGKRPTRPVNSTLMRTWAAESAGIPLWLFEESYHIVGDLGETIALLVPQEGLGIEKPLHV